MVTLPNILSFLRLPLALAFVSPSPAIRVAIIICAALTDFLDGFLARRYKQTSRIGTILDPITDKFFVMVVLAVFYMEGRITIFEIGTLLSRDLALALFGLYLVMSGNLSQYTIRSIWTGKVMTTCQFIILLMLANELTVPFGYYVGCILIGVAALIELIVRKDGKDDST